MLFNSKYNMKQLTFFILFSDGLVQLVRVDRLSQSVENGDEFARLDQAGLALIEHGEGFLQNLKKKKFDLISLDFSMD